MRRRSPCHRARACTSRSLRHAARFFDQSQATAASSALMVQADARRGSVRGRDYGDGAVVYSGARMKLSLVRLVATLLLSGQMLPVGLPLLCDQVHRGTPPSFE